MDYMGLDEQEVKTPQKKPYFTWEVGGKEYNLVLRNKDIIKVEQKLGKNLLMVLEAGLPPLFEMLTIIQGSMQAHCHGISFDKLVDEIYPEYQKSGKGQTDLLTDVVFPIYEVSGFFTEEQMKTLNEELTAES